MKPHDALDALMQFLRLGLLVFCLATYLVAVPPEEEAAPCPNLDHRAFVSHGSHPRMRLYRVFMTAVRSVWVLWVLMMATAHCLESESEQGGGVRMFYADRGSMYAKEFMESGPVLATEEAHRLEADDEKFSVASTVTPGVKVGDTMVP